MILQALKEYYDRKAADPESEIAPDGFERKALPFLIVINKDGKFINLEDTRERIGRRLTTKTFLVPRSTPRSGSLSYQTTFFLWDHIGYVLQHPDDEKAKNQHATWIQMLKDLPEELKKVANIDAVMKFYNSGEIKSVKAHPIWGECIRTASCNMAFKIADEQLPVPCCEAIKEYVKQQTLSASTGEADNAIGRCLITGENDEIIRVSNDTRINKDAKKLVSFQKNCGYDSYGKEQGYNAPIGKKAEFAYTTALNTLLKSDGQRMQVGDAVTVFWASKQDDSEFENKFQPLLNGDWQDFFGEPIVDNPDQGVLAVIGFLRSVHSGLLEIEDKRKFFVLGLAPNVARIAVRFWYADTVKNMARKMEQHFEDLRIVPRRIDSDVLSLKNLLKSIALRQDEKNISPNLAGNTMRSILEGLPYPQTLLQAAIRRIRAEHDIPYVRAALIKACINRSTRFKNPTIKEELQMSLDENNTNIGYRLGRLFATLEKIQKEASPGIKATIRDRFYGAASGTPSTVFGNLMRLKNHHLAKLENTGRRVFFEKLLSQILDGVKAETAFPPHLKLDDQGRFAVGYYHQMQKFFTKKSDNNE